MTPDYIIFNYQSYPKSIILINYLFIITKHRNILCSYYPNASNNKSKYRYNIITYRSIIYILN